MPAIADLQHAFVGDLRTDVIMQPRRFRKGSQHVQLRERARRFLDFLQAPQGAFTDALEQFVFQLHGPLFCAEDFPFHLL